MPARAQRRPHLLRENKRKSLPRHWIFFDTETWSKPGPEKTIEMPFRLGWAVYWRPADEDRQETTEWKKIDAPATFWDFVESKLGNKATVYLVAHNVRFDLVTLAWEKELTQRHFTLASFYESQATQIFRFTRDKQHIVCISSTNLFPGKLEAWGLRINLPKLTVDFEKDSDQYVSIYCKRDVEILLELFRWWTSFLQQENLGNMKITIASQAFSTYRHRFMHHKIHIHTDENASRLEREAYAGGRSQPLRIGKLPEQTYYKLDINSMYPYVMHRHEFPTELVGYREDVSAEDLAYWLQKYLVIADMEIEIDEPAVPVRVEKRIIFPTGRFRTQIATPEIEYVLKHGKVLRVHAASAYRKAKIFDDYVDFWYALKAEYTRKKDPLRRKVTKLFLNSLYGKFGQLHHDTKDLGPYDPSLPPSMKVYDADENTFKHVVALFGHYYSIEADGDAWDTFTAIAAHVTSYARIFLWYSMKLAGLDHVFYTDTDSMIVDQTGYNAVQYRIDPLKLGAWKVEEISNDVEIYAPKHYRFGETLKAKGIPPEAKEIAPGIYEYYQWPGTRTLATRQHLNQYMLIPVTKVLAENVTWGVKLPDGKIRPFHFPDEYPDPALF